MIPTTMGAVLLTGHGGLEQLEYRDDVPVPAPGRGEVLVRIGAASLNNTDINMRTAWYSKPGSGSTGWSGDTLSFPRIQGVDACGTIAALGAGVDVARLGERVLVNPILRAPGDPIEAARYFGSDCNGAFAQYAVLPDRNAHRISSALSDAELATFPCSYSAAENMLSRAGVVAGETVLITGASGGVGSAAVQLARRRGARIIALAHASKAAAVEALGASQVFDSNADLAALVGQGSVHVVIDVVGGRQFPALLDLLKPGGRYAVAGAIGGAEVVLDLRTLYLKDLRLLGCTIFEARVFDDLIGYIERGEIAPLLGKTYPLSDMRVAQSEFIGKAIMGKIVLVPGRNSGQQP